MAGLFWLVGAVVGVFTAFELISVSLSLSLTHLQGDD